MFVRPPRPTIRFGLVRFVPAIWALLAFLWGAHSADAADPTVVQASTPLSGDVITNTTWTRANSPYQVARTIAVRTGVTLTVEPGVEVQFARGEGLDVAGTLIAIGTVTNPITFTGTTPQASAWDGLVFSGTPQAPATGSLQYVTVEYGGSGGLNTANLFLSNAVVTVKNGVFRNGGRHGIHAFDALAHVSDTSFLDHPGYAVLFTNPTGDPVLGRLTASGNGYDGVGLAGGTQLSGNHVWEATGVPYLLVGNVDVAAGATLSIEPGVEVRALPATRLTVGGRLTAIDSASRPITFTGTTKQVGWWQGIVFSGNRQARAAGMLRYVTIEYGGYSGTDRAANVALTSAQVAISHSRIQFSGSQGVHTITDAAGSVVETSQIVSNTKYGVLNLERANMVLATNNWWGVAGGPAPDDANCNPSGRGSRVSAGVSFLPFLTAPDQDPGFVAPGQARILSLSPQRWFAPADGITQLFVAITLRDGNGQPVPGRTVRLKTTLGTAVSGGITDVRGQTFAYVTSSTAGDAVLTAEITLLDSCESVRSPSSTVTFTASSDDALMPGAPAPYLSPIEVSPMPVVRGVPTTLRARLTNPYTSPIAVDSTFSYAQFGLGLTFGPVGTVSKIIPAGETSVFEVPWTPLVTGHFCFELRYTWRSAAGAVSVQQSGGGARPLNLNSFPGPRIPPGPGGKEPLEKARKLTGAGSAGSLGVETWHVSKEAGRLTPAPTLIPELMVHGHLEMAFDATEKISKGLGGDPPRQDYRTLATLERFTFTPVQAGPEVPAARAAAINALMEAALDLNAKYRAAWISFERYGGAAAAEGQLISSQRVWSGQQAAAYVYYLTQSARAMIVVADRIDALLQEWRAEGILDVIVTADAVRAYQARLRTQGFTAAELEAARAVGLTDEEIEESKQDRLAADAVVVAGSVVRQLADVSSAMRELGQALIIAFEPPAGPPTGRVVAKAAPSNLVRIYTAEIPFAVGNPLSQTATIELRTRRIDLPDDWAVTTPLTLTLAPGAQTTVTATVQAGTASVQGQEPRVAVEGHANDALIGGVVLDVVIPDPVTFDGKLRTYLPAVLQAFVAGW